MLLCASDDKLSQAVALDPIGALTTILPTWFLVPFALVAIGGLVSGAVLDIYSSGLTLLTLGLRTPRWVAAAIDGVLMILGTIYIVWVADSFLGVFMAFLIVLGVPMAAWCGIFLADLLLRRHDYDERKLFDRRPRPATARSTLVVGGADGRRHRSSAGGWSSTPPAPARACPGWASCSVRSASAAATAPGPTRTSASRSRCVVGFVGYLRRCRPGAVRRQEASPVREPCTRPDQALSQPLFMLATHPGGGHRPLPGGPMPAQDRTPAQRDAHLRLVRRLRVGLVSAGVARLPRASPASSRPERTRPRRPATPAPAPTPEPPAGRRTLAATDDSSRRGWRGRRRARTTTGQGQSRVSQDQQQGQPQAPARPAAGLQPGTGASHGSSGGS